MDKQQAESIAETLLAPQRERQNQAHEQRLQREAKLKAHRKRGAWALGGFASGAVIGLLTAGSIWPASLVGLLIGALVGVLVIKHV